MKWLAILTLNDISLKMPRIWLSRSRSSVIFFARVLLLGFHMSLLDSDLMNLAGQVYLTLLQARQERGIKDVAISRVEQLSPFPYDMVRRAAAF